MKACTGSVWDGDQVGTDLHLNLGWLLCHSSGVASQSPGHLWPEKSSSLAGPSGALSRFMG